MEIVLGAEDPVVETLTVLDVADERAGQVLQVTADLVEAAGARRGLDEGVAAERLAAPDLGDRRHALAARLLRNRMIDHRVLGRMAARDREVARLGRRPRLR